LKKLLIIALNKPLHTKYWLNWTPGRINSRSARGHCPSVCRSDSPSRHRHAGCHCLWAMVFTFYIYRWWQVMCALFEWGENVANLGCHQLFSIFSWPEYKCSVNLQMCYSVHSIWNYGCIYFEEIVYCDSWVIPWSYI